MIYANQVGLTHGDRILFDSFTYTFSKGRKYALVGANGVGKSSLLRILCGEESPSVGEVIVSKNQTIGFLKQDQHLYDNEEILHVVMQGNAPLFSLFKRKEKLLEEGDWTEEHCEKLADIEEQILHLNGYAAEANAKELLTGLGIFEEKWNLPLNTLSGGWKVRVLLARLLFTQPEILLLDEPTNYLDIASIAWLERFLKNRFSGVLIFISHDHIFIESIADHIVDIDFGEVAIYPGSFSRFEGQKALYQEQRSKERKSIMDQAEKLRSFIDKFRAKPSKAKQCASREKQLEKLVWPDRLVSSRRYPHFHFPIAKNSGKWVLRADNLSKSFENKKVLENVHLEIKKGEKIAIVGRNGSGKSTLIRMLIGTLFPEKGQVETGHNVHPSYFHQEHKDLFMNEHTLLSWLEEHSSGYSETQLRSALGSVLFSSSEVEKRTKILSGGEMARLLIAKIMLEKGNFLVLDEPTNHLDIEGRVALAQALQQYLGTVLLVSHDRHFVQKVATKILLVDSGVVLEHTVSELEDVFSLLAVGE
jgi:ATPase subunit of ABC transporter with duplicated ATPase domains